MATDRKRFLCALIISLSVISIFSPLKATASEALTRVKIDLRKKFSRLILRSSSFKDLPRRRCENRLSFDE